MLAFGSCGDFLKEYSQDKEIKKSELNEDISSTSEEVKEESKKESSFMQTVKEVFVLSVTVLLWLVGAYVCGKLSITHHL